MRDVFTKNLNLEERLFIEKSLKENLSHGRIAYFLNRARSTISQEIHKNGGQLTYNAKEAQDRRDMRQSGRLYKLCYQLSDEKINEIKDMVSKGYSMNRISKVIECAPSTVSLVLKRLKIAIKKQNYTAFMERVEALEEQISLIFETIKEMKNDPKNK